MLFASTFRLGPNRIGDPTNRPLPTENPEEPLRVAPEDPVRLSLNQITGRRLSPTCVLVHFADRIQWPSGATRAYEDLPGRTYRPNGGAVL